MKNIKLIALIGIIILFGACSGGNKKAEGANETKGAKEVLNVATFNLRMKTEKDGINQWKYRVDHLKSLIAYHEFDVFGTQEGFKDQLDDIDQLDNYKYVGVGRDDGKSGGEHSAIFYRTDKYEVLKHGDFWLSETPDKVSFGWDADCRRICTWARLRSKVTNKEFLFFSLHFDHKGDVARLESAKLVIKKINEIDNSDIPLFLVGDFNLTPEKEAIGIIKSELKDSYDVTDMPPYGPVGTHTSFDLNAPMEGRIDYIFINSKVHVLKYAALTDFKDNRFPSDHLPVVIKAELE